MNPLEAAFIGAGLDPKTGRRTVVNNSVSTLLFVFYVIMGGNPFFVVLAISSPIIEHRTTKIAPADAALEALVRRGLVRLGTGNPKVIQPVSGLFGHSLIYFVEVDQAALVAQGRSFFGSKKYSLVDPKTGKSQGGRDASIHGFGATEYHQMLSALSVTPISAPSSSIAGFARFSGGGGVVAGGGAVAAVPHHGGGKKPHPAPMCGHSVCTHLHNSGAGHGAIVLPIFSYKCPDGSNKSVVIMGFEKRSWNLFCEGMESSDNGCWIETIARALREEGKIFLSRHLEDSDIKLGNPIGRTPVFYVQLDRSMVTHYLSRGILNAQVAADNANSILLHCYKEIQAIGFFEKKGNNIVALPGNPVGYPDTFSGVANQWRLS
jgi:hypothetical protein